MLCYLFQNNLPYVEYTRTDDDKKDDDSKCLPYLNLCFIYSNHIDE